MNILLVEDFPTDAELVERELRRGGLQFSLVRVETRDDLTQQLRSDLPDIILADYALPTFDGASALAIAKMHCPHVPFIFVSGTIGEETAIAALKDGAVDYVLKNNLKRLAAAVQRAIDDAAATRARIAAESQLRDLIEYAPHALVVLDQHGRIKIVNAQAELLFGQLRQQMISAAIGGLITQPFAQWPSLVITADQRTGSMTFETIGWHSNGETFPVEISISPLQTSDGCLISSVIRDLSERKQQEEKLARMTRIRTILGSINSVMLRVRDKKKLLGEACRIAFEDGNFSGAAVGLVDLDTRRVHPAAWAGLDGDFLGSLDISIDPNLASGQGVVGRVLRERRSICINDLANDPHPIVLRSTFIARGYQSAFIAPLLAGDRALGVLALLSKSKDAFNDEEQHLLNELADDISFSYDFIDKEEKINFLEYFDVLTGLPNRALFQQRLGQLTTMEFFGGHCVLAVVLIDIERFRHINDTFGRADGDQLLRVVGKRLSSCLPENTCVARISADIFGFIITVRSIGSNHGGSSESRSDSSEIDVVHLIESTVLARLSEPHQIGERSVRLSARAGIALFPDDGNDSDSLLRNAEAALKGAKEARLRHLFYTAEMNARTAEKLSLEYRLRRAFDEQQFVLHYQPKFDLQTGVLSGMEALIRWQEPDVGLHLPGRFIQMLEDTGLIVDVGLWVIARAHRQFSEWEAQGLCVPRIAVNVSQLQIRQKNFVDDVLRVLGTAPRSLLEIEITESLFMDDVDKNIARDKLVSLREAGLTVAIDDFGTGYSSLSYLARLPIDTLKIDRSFITDMTASTESRTIVQTILSLARSLKLKVVAEGVETDAQRAQLQALGCDQMQGFLISPAVPADQMAAMLKLASLP